MKVDGVVFVDAEIHGEGENTRDDGCKIYHLPELVDVQRVGVKTVSGNPVSKHGVDHDREHNGDVC